MCTGFAAILSQTLVSLSARAGAIWGQPGDRKQHPTGDQSANERQRHLLETTGRRIDAAVASISDQQPLG